MGFVIKHFGELWVFIGVVAAGLAIANAASLPDPWSTGIGVWAVLGFVTAFLVPGGTMYCVGDLHHQLVSKSNDEEYEVEI